MDISSTRAIKSKIIMILVTAYTKEMKIELEPLKKIIMTKKDISKGKTPCKCLDIKASTSEGLVTTQKK